MPAEAIFPQEYFVYYKGKWCTAGGKGPLFGHVDGFQIDPKSISIFIYFKEETRMIRILFICHGSIAVKAKVLDSLANSGFENCILPLQFMGQT